MKTTPIRKKIALRLPVTAPLATEDISPKVKICETTVVEIAPENC